VRFVVDASFIASLFLPDEASEATSKLAGQIAAEGATAPALFQIEVTNILLMAARRKRISGAQFMAVSDGLDSFPITLQPPLTVQQRRDVQRLAENHRLTAYDAVYLELAMRLRLVLASLDEALVKAASAEGVKLAL
jgi:predicted nucleic acid-binding protein